jgi:hypothetical protein
MWGGMVKAAVAELDSLHIAAHGYENSNEATIKLYGNIDVFAVAPWQ